ncbi:MAG: NYN domain-containing protein [Deltaproteobacteria bacterium]|nr:NYN domain-containing protein [Deltaproteobacteria bacterium]
MTEQRVAVLIDADNVSGANAAAVIAEAGRHGRLVIRRIYGDWTRNAGQKWKAVLADLAIQPIQQFANTVGKNATDSTLIIDAMDLLHQDLADVFCIVSSDADFTRLASRLRESAKVVVGIGRRKTPKAFVHACERFVFIENLVQDDELAPAPSASASSRGRGRGGRGGSTQRGGGARSAAVDADAQDGELNDADATEVDDASAPVEVPALGPLLAQAYDNAENDDGYAFLGSIGNQLQKLDPSFDPRNYAHRQLRLLVAAQPGYRVESAPGKNSLIVTRSADS